MRDKRPGLFESAGWCGGRVAGREMVLPAHFWTDSRDVLPGDAFVALPGGNANGHRFVGDAISRGARLILGTEGGLEPWLPDMEKHGLSFLLVDDTEKALVRIAEAYLEEVAPRERVAVTGSVGKTTTRELIRASLEGSARVHAARRSHNTLIGCALTVIGMAPDTEVLVFEMGTNHPGEIAGIVDHFPPTIAVVTAIAPVHLEGLTSLEGVLAAKLEIIPPRGLTSLVFNGDDAQLCGALGKGSFSYRVAGVGFNKGCTLLLTEAANDSEGNLCVGMSYGGQSWICHSSLRGAHHAYNLGFAMMVGISIGISPEKLLKGMSAVAPLRGRGMWIRGGSVRLLIDESYNANPSSVSAALEVLKTLPEVGGRRWAVLGGMKELGKSSGDMHRLILENTAFLDGVVLVGEEWKVAENPADEPRIPYWRVQDANSAITLLRGLVGKEDTVLVKGSRSYGLEVVVEGLAKA